MLLLISSSVLHFTEFHFSVVDTKVIKTSFQTKLNHPHPLLSAWQKLSLGVQQGVLECFFLSMNKVERVLISIPWTLDKMFQIFDGPGIFSQVLEPHLILNDTILYKTSTFQSVIHEYHLKTTKITAVDFSPEQQKISSYFMMRANSERNRTYLGVDSLMVFSFTTSAGFYIRVANIDIHHSLNFNTEDCRYAGVATNENAEPLCPKYVALPKDPKHKEYQFPNLYSTNNTMLLILYAYGEYGHMNASFTLGTTRCKAIVVDTCNQNKHQITLPPGCKFLPNLQKFLLEGDCLILQHTKSGNASKTEQNGNKVPKLIQAAADVWLEIDNSLIIFLAISGFLRGEQTRTLSNLLAHF